MKISPDTTDDALAVVAEQIEIDVQGIKNSVDRVLSESLFWFPVRHHSPTVAKYLQDAIQRRKPKMLFIEGPAEANELIRYVVDAATRPPIAIYTSYRDDDNVLGLSGIVSASPDIPARFASWYPLLPYSPEYVAMLLAKKLGIAVKFMDLPHHALIKPVSAVPDAADTAADEQPDDKKKAPEGKNRSENLMLESSFYQRLAGVAGYRTFNEAWDSLFEIRDFQDDMEFFRREVATFCAASRATASPEQMELDGTLARERFMLKTIRETMQAENLKPEECMVICGGFHLFLDACDSLAPPECPAGTVYKTVVPYSFFRFSELSGYGAGNRAPQFYQTLWDLRSHSRERDL
ncbi:MAG: hypothetical protein JST44_18250, partial [Cyanobacteria bacterium SZAS LIN-5]|nr:hypothetical protein [Cyanobacteria bacterium SZAS LIN-5]